MSVSTCSISIFDIGVDTDGKFLRSRRAVELVQASKSTVKAPHIKEVVQTLQNSPTAAFLKDLSFHERLMLASLIKCIKREGVEEIKWSEVISSLLSVFPFQN